MKTKDLAHSDLDGFRPYMVHNGVGLKRCMIKNGFKWICASCSITEWLGQKAPLQVNHINGVKANNMRSNLELLCPNCHALTDNYCGKNIKRPPVSERDIIHAYDRVLAKRGIVSANAIRVELGSRVHSSSDVERLKTICEAHNRPLATKMPPVGRNKIQWPGDQIIASMLFTKSLLEVGEILGVSDNAVKKRCLKRGIEIPQHNRARTPKKPHHATVAKLERDQKAQTRNKAMQKLSQKHGTRAGYFLERRLGLQTCALCREANTEYSRRLRSN